MSSLGLRSATPEELAAAEPTRIVIEHAWRASTIAQSLVCEGRLLERRAPSAASRPAILLVRRRGHAPLTIVRPRIISACWHYPVAGWIDSKAALAAFVALMGAGYMRAIVADPAARLDIVPCDEVAARVVEETFALADRPSPDIVHATAGRARSLTVGHIAELLIAFFRRHPVGRPAQLAYLGPRGLRYQAHRLLQHRAPALAAQLACLIRGDRKGFKRLGRGASKLDRVNELFAYFTHRSFDFRSRAPPHGRVDHAGLSIRSIPSRLNTTRHRLRCASWSGPLTRAMTLR